MTNITVSLPLISYGLAGLVYLVLSVLLLTSFRGRLRGGLLTAAAIVTAAWAFLLAWNVQADGLTASQLLVIEFLHDAAWLVFLSALLSGAVGAAQYWLVRYGGILLVAALLGIGLYQEWNLLANLRGSGSGGTLILGSLLTSLYALVAIEQIYRNARESQRRGLKFLCLGTGAIFAYDLFLYSNAILNGQISDLYWGVRGFIVAMSAPMIAVAAQRSPTWAVGIFVSRQVVFYTTTLFGAGVYLSAIGFAGYYIRNIAGGWGQAAQVVLFAAAVLALFVFLFSTGARRRLRVFISKHFYENKYDYREEWLRLTATLTSLEESLPLRKRAIKGLAQILDSRSGFLWLRSSVSSDYRCVAGWNVQRQGGEIAADSAMANFLRSTGWVIDLTEYRVDSSHYQDVEIKPEEVAPDDAGIIIPLLHDADLLGFVALSEPSSRPELNFEDRDLLKTAGQQIASYLSQEEATEQLAEGRQFEAFNRFTAYLMHDLKNVIAQQSLVVENAEKHKDNPAFIDDAVDTIKSSVVRMRRIIKHLTQGASDQPQERVELSKLIITSVSQCADRQPEPQAEVSDGPVWVRADRDRLLMALNHAIRNAQDATGHDGDVQVQLSRDDGIGQISIVDNGSGMDAAFVRERLFKPFDSTKGTQGMGIGAYQIRETLKSVGGTLEIDSTEGVGTTLTMTLQTVSE